MLVPGLGQLVVGAYRRAIVLLSLTAAILLASGAVALVHPTLGLRLLLAILAVLAAAAVAGLPSAGRASRVAVAESLRTE